MKIGMRGGHSPNCKGASGYLDEQSCVRALYYKIKPLLEAQGHTVIDCNSNASSQNQELYEGTYKCNTNHCDLYIPLHMNATPGGHGVECWTYSSNSSTANAIGSRVCSNLSTIGLSNRGVKHSTGLHDTRSACGQTCLIEVLFCDNKHDCDIWNNQGIDKIARLIASAICNKTVTCSSSSSSSSSTSHSSSSSVYGNHALIRELQQEINRQGFGNIAVDGIAGEATISHAPMCRQGARGNISKIIQKMLIHIGYPVGSYGADGCFGGGTFTAVKAFQRDCGLGADGIVGRETWKALFRNL